ncbi:MAG: hypothetical protein KDC27_18390 [Acidobacteria bacterium]|nr:hypothetical protein [Acidobacteriota bacterium]
MTSILLAGCTSGTGASGNLDSVGAERGRLVAETTARLSADEGGRVMLKAIEAHGGLEAWFRTRSSVSLWEYHQLPAGRSFTSRLMGERSGQRVYQELQYFDSAGAKRGSGRFGWNGKEGWLEMEGAISRADRLRHRAAATFYLERVPFVFALQNIHYELLQPEDLDGAPNDRIRISISGGVGDARFIVYIDQLTGRVSAVRYAFPTESPETGIDSLRSGLLRYQEFFTVDGLTLPTRMTLYPVRNEVPGDATYEAVCREITFRESFDQSSLERPEGAILLSENDVQ